MTDPPRERSAIDRMRRTVLKSSILGGLLATIPTMPASATDPSQATSEETASENERLLPADRTVPGEPTEHSSGPGDPIPERQTRNLTASGQVEIDVEGEFEGEGEYALNVSPYLESTWTAPESGEYVITAQYTVDGEARQVAYEQGGASAVTSILTNVSIREPDSTVVNQRTSEDHRTVNRDHLPEQTMRAINILGRFILNFILSGLGKIIAKIILPLITDSVFDEEGREEKSIQEDGEVQVKFLAEAGQTYHIRLSTIGGFSGKSERSDSGFRANLSATTQLAEFSVSPSGSAVERSNNTLTVTKEGTDDGFGAYMLSTTGEIWQEEDSEAVIHGSSAMDFVGPKSGTDRLRFAGDIENFLLKGQATVLLNGDEVNPESLGTVVELSNTLTVKSAGTGKTGFYAVTVSGDIVPGAGGNSESLVRGSSAIDWVGGKRGTDHFRFSGDILDFILKGDAEVYLNGKRVNPGELGI